MNEQTISKPMKSFHVGLFIRQYEQGDVRTWLEASPDLKTPPLEVLDILEEAISVFRDRLAEINLQTETFEP